MRYSLSVSLKFTTLYQEFLLSRVCDYIKIENFRTEKFRKNNFGQKTFGCFVRNFGQKVSDKRDIKNKHYMKMNVKNNCDPIININLL